MPTLATEVLIAFGSLFSIVDPFSALPLFLALVGARDREEQSAVALRASLTCFFVLTTFGAAGTVIFHFFGITLPAFKIAGGILLFGTGLEMIRAKHADTRATPEEQRDPHDDVAVIPIGIPLLAGPGAIAAVMVLGAKSQGFGARVAVEIAVIAVSLISFLVLRSSTLFARVLHRTGINLIGRLMGLLLAALAIQFVIDGVSEAFPRLTAVAEAPAPAK